MPLLFWVMLLLYKIREKLQAMKKRLEADKSKEVGTSFVFEL